MREDDLDVTGEWKDEPGERVFVATARLKKTGEVVETVNGRLSLTTNPELIQYIGAADLAEIERGVINACKFAAIKSVGQRGANALEKEVWFYDEGTGKFISGTLIGGPPPASAAYIPVPVRVMVNGAQVGLTSDRIFDSEEEAQKARDAARGR
jgi:hypothetical protein